MAASKKKAFHEEVAEKLIEQLKAGTAPWQKPWEPGTGGFMPLNPTTGNRYKGINAIHLMAQGYSDNRWMTYRQASKEGAQVRRGEKGTSIQFWKFSEEQTKRDESGRPVLDAEGKPVKETVQLERPRVFFATVFNAEQIDGLPALEQKPQAWNAVERAESILKASGAEIRHGEHDQAFYRPSTDSIHLPDRGQFPTADAYYATALHELGHWTGHGSRLDRDLSHPFGSQGYAKEELRAEISSMILGDELGIGHDPEQHAAYVGSWIKALQEDPLEIFRASADAEKIHDYVLAFEQKQVQELERDEDLALNQELRENGQQIVSHVEAQDRWGKGERIYAFHDQDGEPHLVRSLDELDKYAPDQMLALPALVLEQNEVNTMTANIDKLPGSLVDRLVDNGIMTRPDAEATSALRDLHAGTESTRAVDAQAFKEASEKAFGFALPQDWGGNIQVQGCVYEMIGGERHVEAANAIGKEPEFWGVYAELESGLHEWLADFDTQEQAEKVALRLQAIGEQAAFNLDGVATEQLGRADSLLDAVKHYKLVDPRYDAEYVRENAGEMIDIAEKAGASRFQAVMASGEVVQVKKDASGEWRRADGLQLPDEVQGQQEVGQVQQSVEREYINVPYKEKNEAKGLGARWDRQERSWYIPAGVDASPFEKWTGERRKAIEQGEVSQDNTGSQKQYLAVPYGERGAAKQAGAKWDKAAKSWYVGPNGDMDRLKRWLPENVPNQQGPAMSPREEFAEALKAAGCVVSGNHPIMDGKKHRISVEGDGKGDKGGVYIGYLDGHPAGFIKNYRTTVEMNWKSKGYTLSPEEKAKLQAESAKKLAEREAETDRLQNAVADRVTRQTEGLVPVSNQTPYLQSKNIQPHKGAYTDQSGEKTFIPAYDTAGRQWTMQYIQEDGTKRFAKDSRKEGSFHVVGGLDALKDAPALVIAEGYATAATGAEALGFATVAAFDASNLAKVGKVLQEKYPDKPVVFLGDDDRHLVSILGHNPGREKAEQAAKEIGGKAIFPVFAPGEADYPKGLQPVTPQSYRKHKQALEALKTAPEHEVAGLKRLLLSDDQVGALDRQKRHSDFNDLATKSSLGREGAVRQIRSSVSKIRAGIPNAIKEVEQERCNKQVPQQEVKQKRVSRAQ